MMSSVNHDDFAHLKIPLENILTATKKFDDENFIGIGGFGNYYKGQLLWSGELINIYAQRLNKEWNDETEQQFWAEISMLSSLEHRNIVSFVGFCDENGEKIIINKYENWASLENYLSETMMLTWVRRLEICVGVAHALSYIHYDEDRHFSVIHGNIDSGTILLNDNFEPKLSEFRLPMKIEAFQRHHSFRVDKFCDWEGYTDPTYIETKVVSHKSDIYSFGIVMFELLCGRKSVIANDTNKYLAPMAITHYREEKLHEIIDWDLWQQMDSESFKIFAETAYDCVNEERSQRPSIDEIVPKLEIALKHACGNRPTHKEIYTMMSSINHDDLAHLKIPLEDVLDAIDNFDEEHLIGEKTSEKIYEGVLLWSGELISIIARRLNKEWFDGDDRQFWTAISLLSTLKHKNLVSLVGFCDEKDEKIIIINCCDLTGSLSLYLTDPMLLTWVRRLEICVGIAHGLSYIHYDGSHDFSVLHLSIDSTSIYLKDDWVPKLGDFIRSVKIKASQRHHSFNTDIVWSTDGCTDPAYTETKRANHKSDMYSFGIVMLELLCGRESIINDDQDNKYLAPLAITHYREKKLHEIIDWDLWKQMDSESFNILAETAYDCLNEERSQRPNIDEIVLKLENALKYARENNPIMSNEFAHLRVPLENIISTTNNFARENIIFKDEFEKRYMGQLLWSGELIDITARRFNKEWNDGEQMFWMDISMLSSLKHKNIVSLVGFCDENDEKIIIARRDTRGILVKYLSDPMLTWVRRLEICANLAHALSYIHYDEPREFSVINRAIDCSRVLLSDEWEPKLFSFERSMNVKATQRHHSFHTNIVKGFYGYVDPTYIETKRVSHKSDIYSFGIVLFELLCSRISKSEQPDNKYLATVAIFHYKKKTLDEIIDPVLWKQMDPQSFNAFAKTAFDCLNEVRSQRPNIDEIVTRLESALKLQMECQNDENSIGAAKFEDTPSNHDKGSLTSISTRVESRVSKETKSLLKDLSHLKLSYEDMESATNNFNFDKIYLFKREVLMNNNSIANHFTHFKHLMDMNVKCFFTRNTISESKKFWMEILMLSSLKHKNLVSLIGFCVEEVEEEWKYIVYKQETKQSLKACVSDQNLTWLQRLKICLGVANALSYLHYDPGRDFSVIHGNIRSSNILLDGKWEPKLFGFELSLKNTVVRRHRLLLTRDVNDNVYLDPKYKKTGGLSHKSDVYSFGVVLLEVLCGMSAIDDDEDKDEDEEDNYDKLGEGLLEEDDDDELREGLLSKLAKSHLDDMIMPHLRKEMDTESFKIFSETAYWCMKEDRAERPYIDQVVKRLQKALEHQWKHENPVLKRTPSPIHYQLKGNLEHLKIELNDIIEATKNFEDACIIGSGGFGKVYIADLEHFDSTNSSLIEGVDKCDLPRKRSTVAIKRINNQEGEQGFITEIETLTTCKHENIISLLGFCYEGNGAMILVYEHASKGSLEDYLGSSDKTNLSWVQRIKICLDIAHGLNYIHSNTDHGKQKMIHRDIKSANILLGDNWKAKISDFGLSKFHPQDQDASTINASTIAGTDTYLDPEYDKFGRLNKKSDIYSFGVVLFEILTGKLAYDRIFTHVDDKGIAPIARHHFENGTLMEIVDHKIKEETDEHRKTSNYRKCHRKTQAKRPTIENVIEKLQKVLTCQENHKDNLKLSLQNIKLATQTFSQENIIGHGGFWIVYRGVTQAHGNNIIAVKRLEKKSAEGEAEFMTELEILMEYKHENIIDLVGYCDEEDEKIIVYNFASRGSLNYYLSDDRLTWVMRLKICLDIAIGLEFLHGTASRPEMVIHRDINSSNILLLDDWKAKISDFGLSLVCPTNQDVDYVIDNVTGKIGYQDPLQAESGFLTKESDIFSLGAVLFDILCGKLSSEKLDDEYLYLPFLAKQHCQVGKLDELVFEGIKEQIDPQSNITFTSIALQCLHHKRERRPTAHEVVIQLKKSLEFQEDYEKWEPKLPKDYKEIIQMSKCPDIYYTMKKEDLYNIFSKGILLQQDKVLMPFSGGRERNEMVSSTMFSYLGSCPHEWEYLPESRFGTVVKILDISNLFIKIKTRAQFLSRNVVYGVYLVFKFCESSNFASKPMYVDLNYTKGHKSLNAYFATRRDNDWMMIELYRFLNKNEDVVFEFLLECFSSFHCGDGAIYVEGIEFRAIEKAKPEIEKLEDGNQVLKTNFANQALQLPTNFEEIFKISRNYDELFWLGEVNGKKLLMLSAKATLYKFSNLNLFISTPSAHSRFQEVIELLPQRVFHINCTIRSQMLSPDTEYVCYLLFKLSANCQGMHCPLKGRDVLHQENNEAEFFYFSTPSPLNIHDITRVPKQREDGWMEIQVWKFNSACEFKDDTLSMNMKFSSLDGTMSGLVVCGLEFRPL